MSTDDSHSSPMATVVAMTTLKEKPKIPPKPKTATLKRRGIILETEELDESEVAFNNTGVLFLFRIIAHS